ncbi:MAG: hypothetical protein VYD53_18185 [Pseudomonadota bacterium]|nr:hypothetical protein [Pseudomonadota bacterium]
MLPEFDKLPSVLTYEEVEKQLQIVMDIAENHAEPPIYMIQETINDGLSALEYNPRGYFSAAIESRVSSWAMSHWNWEKGDRDFIDGLTAIIINFSSLSASRQFFEEMLHTETR